MFGVFKRLFGSKPLPTPPAKEHPLVKAAREKAKPAKQAFGIVYSSDGTPKISPDWVKNLPSTVRPRITKDLADKGWEIDPETFEVRRIKE